MMRTLFGFLLFSLLIVLACHKQGATNNAESDAAEQRVPQASNTQRMAEKRSRQIDVTTFRVLSEEAQRTVAAAPVPVLAPAEPALLRSTKAVTGPGYYALSAREQGVTVSIQGSPVGGEQHLTVEVQAAGTIVGDRRVFTTVNEGIRTATWVENGVAYSVDVECEKRADSRCESDKYLTDIVGKMKWVGGGAR